MDNALTWKVEGMGGGCTAFSANRNGYKYLITSTDGGGIPVPDERALLGVYLMDDDAPELMMEFCNSQVAITLREKDSEDHSSGRLAACTDGGTQRAGSRGGGRPRRVLRDLFRITP